MGIGENRNATAISWLMAAGLLFALPCWGAVYRCGTASQPLFTDQPCDGDASTADLPQLGSAPAAASTDTGLAAQYDRRVAADRRERDRASEQWIRDYDGRRQQAEMVRSALVEGRVVAGMTPAQVESVLGLPTRESRRNGLPHRWVYVNGRTRHTVEFADGVVRRTSSRNDRR